MATKLRFNCEKGIEHIVEQFVDSYAPYMFKRILKQAGCQPDFSIVVEGNSYHKEEIYNVTMEVIAVIHAKGFRRLGDLQMKQEADALLDMINDCMDDDSLADTTQVCSDCHKEKALTEFYRNRTKKLGVNNICKECQKKRNWKRTERKAADEE